MKLGFDTGFFVRLLERDQEAGEAWHSIAHGSAQGLVCCLTLYELRKIGLRGALRLDLVQRFLVQLPSVCRILWITETGLLDRAAHVAHGNGMSMADAIILVVLMENGAERIYTTDRDFEKYSGASEIRRL